MMKKIILTVFILLLLSGCGSAPPEVEDVRTQTPSATIKPLPTLTNTPTIFPPTQSPTQLPEHTEITICEHAIEFTNHGYFMKTWSYTDDNLFYTEDIDRQIWHSYPDNGELFGIDDVFPFVTPELEEIIPNPRGPYFSFSPSGKQALYWIQTYSSEDKYQNDIYRVSENGETTQYVTRVQGAITNAYWSNDERYVYLTFELLFPGNFLLRVDLEENFVEVILPGGAEQRYWNWIALSPDGKWLAFNHSTPNQISILNLETNETQNIGGLPEYQGMIWMDENRWFLVDSNKQGTTFYDVEAMSNRILLTSMYQIELVEAFYGSTIPALSPNRNKIAFQGRDILNGNAGLYILYLCPYP